MYSHSKGRYLCQDKYYGRELTAETVPQALEQFFSLNLDHTPRNCSRGTAIVTALLARLAALKEVMKSLSGLRLYSTSILAMYEGDVSATAADASNLVDVSSAWVCVCVCVLLSLSLSVCHKLCVHGATQCLDLRCGATATIITLHSQRCNFVWLQGTAN